MKQIDSRLMRLFQAAARAQRPVPQTPPYGFETRVLAHWRTAVPEMSMAPVFRRAFLVCSALMLLAAAFEYSAGSSGTSSTELAVADSAIELSLP